MSQATQLFQSKLQNIRLAEYGGAEPRWANVVQSDPTQMGYRGGGYASQATAAVDTTGDGRANALVTGVDRNHDGIPDALQGGGMRGDAMGYRGGGYSPQGREAEREFDRLDRNGDGVISEREFQRDYRDGQVGSPYGGRTSRREAERDFDRLDRNGDGVISERELQRDYRDGQVGSSYGGRTARRAAEREFDRLDRNGDGVISEREFKRDARQRNGPSKRPSTARQCVRIREAEREFDRLDRNGDGVITQREFRKANQSASSRRSPVRRNTKRSISAQRRLRKTVSTRGAEREFDRLDRNGDGVISEREFKQDYRDGQVGSPYGGMGRGRAAEREFDRLDRNGDGAISERELQQGYGIQQNPNPQVGAAYGSLIQQLQQEITMKDAEIAQYTPAQYAASPPTQAFGAVSGAGMTNPPFMQNMQTGLVPQMPAQSNAAISELQSNIQAAASKLQNLQYSINNQGGGMMGGYRGGGYASQATAAVDTTGDGRANALVSGVDRNHDGIPDALQGGAMGYRGGATNRNTGILQSFRSDLQGMMNEAQAWRYAVCLNCYSCTQLFVLVLRRSTQQQGGYDPSFYENNGYNTAGY